MMSARRLQRAGRLLQRARNAAPVPATPPATPRRRWGVYAGWRACSRPRHRGRRLCQSGNSTASGAPSKTEQVETRAPTPPQPPVAAPTPTPAPAPHRRQLLRRRATRAFRVRAARLARLSEWTGPRFTAAHGRRAAGEKVIVEVRRDGYRPQKLTLDGADAKVKVRLVRIPGRAIARPPTPTRGPLSGASGGAPRRRRYRHPWRSNGA